MRRLPIYLLLDTSGSMHGEPIQAVNTGVEVMISSLRQDPHALETVSVSIITFDSEARVLTPLTPLDEFIAPEIMTPKSGPTHLGMALEVLRARVSSELINPTDEEKGDWAPFLFVMTDGKPSDIQLFESECSKVRDIGFANIIGCVAGPKAKKEDIESLCDHVVSLDTMDSAGFAGFFKWVSSAIATGNRSIGTSVSNDLPPPPPEISVVF